MAQSENNTNTMNNNGKIRLAFEMPAARSRHHFLQQNSVGRRVIAATDQYVTPPFRVRIFIIFITFFFFLKIS